MASQLYLTFVKPIHFSHTEELIVYVAYIYTLYQLLLAGLVPNLAFYHEFPYRSITDAWRLRALIAWADYRRIL